MLFCMKIWGMICSFKFYHIDTLMLNFISWQKINIMDILIKTLFML